MSGFVYIWFDRKHKRYYVGSHWGTPDDGYICSSWYMLRAYKKRPEDFKRRIICFITTNKKSLLKEEFRYLGMIHPEELSKRYYNRYVPACGPYNNFAGKKHSKSSKEKMVWTEERRQRQSEIMKEKGFVVSIESRKKRSQTIRDNATFKAEKNPMHGQTHTSENREKIRQANIGRTMPDDHRRKLSELGRTRDLSYLQSPENKQKIRETKRLNKLRKLQENNS